MEQVHLKYGTSAVDFEIDGAKSVKYLYENKMRVIEDIKAEFLHCVTDGVIGTKPLKELIAPTDPVTIVINSFNGFRANHTIRQAMQIFCFVLSSMTRHLIFIQVFYTLRTVNLKIDRRRSVL